MKAFWLQFGLAMLIGESFAYCSWRSVGPRTASPLAAAATDSTPTVVLCAVANGTRVFLFRSTDNGLTWPDLVDSLEFRPWAMAFAPGDRQTVYATAGGVWKSTDQGATWQQLATPDGRSYFGLATARQRPYVVWAAGHFATTSGGQAVVAKSTDRGATWTEFVCDSLPRTGVQSVAPDPTNDSVVYAGGAVAGQAVVWKSTDSGVSWTRTSLPVPPLDSGGPERPPPQEEPIKGAVHTLCVNTIAPCTLTAAVEWSGLYRSTDAGRSWRRLSGIPEAHSLVFASNFPNYGLVGLTSGVKQTVNGGASWDWSLDPPGGGVVRCLVIAADSARTSWCATPSSICRSTNGGLKWYAARILAAGPISAVYILQFQGDHLFAAVTGDGLYHSSSFGDRWDKCGAFSGSEGIVSITAGSRAVWALSDAGLCRSTNFGASWMFVGDWFDRAGSLGFSVHLPRIAVASGSLYDSAHVLHFALARTTDGGLSWRDSMLPQVGTCRTGAVNEYGSVSVLIGGDSAGVPIAYRSLDSGRTWRRHAAGLLGAVQWIGFPTDYPYTWELCATDSGVFVCYAGDTVWQRIWNRPTHSLFHDDYEHTFLTAATDSGVFIYHARYGWQPFSDGLPDGCVLVLNGDWTYPPLMYAGTQDAGLFETSIPLGVGEWRSPQVGAHGRTGQTVVCGILELDGRPAVAGSRMVLLDATGRVATKLHCGSNDVSHLAPGVYFVREDTRLWRMVLVR